MIYINLVSDGSEYGTKHIVWLFYSEEVMFIDDERFQEKLYIKLCINNHDEFYEFFCELYEKGIQKVYKSFKVPKYIPALNENKITISLKDKRIKKKNLNRILYSSLVQYTGKELPWGMLTGIRPLKVYHQIKNNGIEEEEIKKILLEKYFISPKKVNLISEVAKNEISIFNTASPRKASIYIGIPFCRTTCLYCSFTSNVVSEYKHLINKYISTLIYELENVMQIIQGKGYDIQSVYIGGGTPTSITAEQLELMLGEIERIIPFNNVVEYTLEAGRPDSINIDKLKVIKNSLVNRISINPQTMNNTTLELIGRHHTAEDIIEKYQLARKLGFNNINMDLIVGLPNEDLSMFESSLDKVLKLEPDSLTVHTLAIKKASKLYEQKDKFRFASQKDIEEMVDTAYGKAKANSYNPYYVYRQKNILGNLENIGYAKKGYESIYNIQIMEEKQTIFAFGAGAVSKMWYSNENTLKRAFNVKNVEQYIERINQMIERKNELINN